MFFTCGWSCSSICTSCCSSYPVTGGGSYSSSSRSNCSWCTTQILQSSVFSNPVKIVGNLGEDIWNLVCAGGGTKGANTGNHPIVVRVLIEKRAPTFSSTGITLDNVRFAKGSFFIAKYKHNMCRLIKRNSTLVIAFIKKDLVICGAHLIFSEMCFSSFWQEFVVFTLTCFQFNLFEFCISEEKKLSNIDTYRQNLDYPARWECLGMPSKHSDFFWVRGYFCFLP